MTVNESFDAIRLTVDNRATAIRIACELEAFAPKLGNVHPQASFEDCSLRDFLEAAKQVAPVLGNSDPQVGLGTRVLDAVRTTREVTAANVNLGIILLIAPLAMARDRHDLRNVLGSLTPHDGQLVFEAIRVASPGGMQRDDVAPECDVETPQTQAIDLVAAMRQAAYRDRIALQYATDFADFFERVVPVVSNHLSRPIAATEAIVDAQLQLLSTDLDSLIVRKCGLDVAFEARARAIDCLSNDSLQGRQSFDRWLRADKNRRNPGTTADFLAAALYWLLINDRD